MQLGRYRGTAGPRALRPEDEENPLGSPRSQSSPRSSHSKRRRFRTRRVAVLALVVLVAALLGCVFFFVQQKVGVPVDQLTASPTSKVGQAVEGGGHISTPTQPTPAPDGRGTLPSATNAAAAVKSNNDDDDKEEDLEKGGDPDNLELEREGDTTTATPAVRRSQIPPGDGDEEEEQQQPGGATDPPLLEEAVSHTSPATSTLTETTHAVPPTSPPNEEDPEEDETTKKAVPDTPTITTTAVPADRDDDDDEVEETSPVKRSGAATVTAAATVNGRRRPRRTIKPAASQVNDTFQVEDGEYSPEEPRLLPGLSVKRRTYTPEELLERHGSMMFVYSFVNGTDAGRFFRKHMLGRCGNAIMEVEREWYEKGAVPHYEPPESLEPYVVPTKDPATTNGTTTAPKLGVMLPRPPYVNCLPPFLHAVNIETNRKFLDYSEQLATRAADYSDRESDELRHSLRSIEQHIKWHRGRVVMVSPGNHPTWIDPAKNFFAGTCGGPEVAALREQGTHLRVTTVHQDSLLPYGLRLTVDSHVIEQHLWRVKGITPVHIYWNDDYFANRDIKITDYLNEYGGTIVRTERGKLRGGKVGGDGGAWVEAVYHTQLFNIRELDHYHEDYLPPLLRKLWREERGVTAKHPNVQPPNLYDIIDTAYTYSMEPLPNRSYRPRRVRRYATHAPFAYCTRMHQFMETRYEREFSINGLNHRSRRARDYLIPFVYNAFIMARPWIASPKVLPYLVELNARAPDEGTPAPITIDLDNEDGCAPARLFGGIHASQCKFAKFFDNSTANVLEVQKINEANPLYFNINSGFGSKKAVNELRRFLGDRFPQATYLERRVKPAPIDGDDAALPELYRSLMALPVIVIASFEEGLCPVARSLQLGLPDHTGPLFAVRHRFSDDEVDVTLAELRKTLGHRVMSAMPAVRCVFNTTRVTSKEAPMQQSLTDIIADVLKEVEKEELPGVAVPAACTVNSGLRVRAIVVDARTLSLSKMGQRELREAIGMPAQTLAFEDFNTLSVDDEESVALVLSRADAEANNIHWIEGAAETDLYVTYPLPYRNYEDMDVNVTWVY